MSALIPEEVERLIDAALHEDLNKIGDITSKYFVAPDMQSRGRIVAREAGIMAGCAVAARVFEKIDPRTTCSLIKNDGENFFEQDALIEVNGPAQSLLTAERTALNFLQRLCAIATKTNAFVKAVEGTRAKILDTRKTLPGWRWLDKMAVRAGGGSNHRFGLYDRAMIKDNHLQSMGFGGLQAAINQLKTDHPGIKVEIEVDHLAQFQIVHALDGVDFILLDNMTNEQLRKAVDLNQGKVALEASGGVRLDTIRDIAETGVDFISVGAITHSVSAIDLGLDFCA